MEKRGEKLCPPQPGEAPSPWLVYTHGNDKKIQTFCTLSPLPPHNKSYVKSIPELCGDNIFASFDDWLLLRDFDYNNIFSLCNVVTLQWISLPVLSLFLEWEDDQDISTCALLPSLTAQNDIVVILFYKAIVFSCRVTLTASSTSTPTSWDQQNIEIDGGKTVIRWVSSTVSCNGVLYCTAQTDTGGIVVTVELADHGLVSNSFIFKSLGIKDPPLGHCFHSLKFRRSMVESCGVLYTIFSSLRVACRIQQIIKVEIWELDLSHLSWVPVDCLGNRAFFVGSRSSTWCWASSEGGFEGNCIYFASEDDETIYSYRLDDDSFTFLLPCSNLHTPFYGPTWVMPLQQRLLAPREFGTTIIKKIEKLSQGNMVIEQREVEQQKNETQENILSELPWDVISLISTHLHLFDYLNFRASCKTFRSVVPHTRRRPNNSLPLFMFSNNGNGLCQLRDPCRNDSYSVMIPHSPAVPTEIEFSKNGWLVICTGDQSLQFLNPFTRVKGEFPPCEFIYILSSIGFSTSPTCSDCLTVGILECVSCVLIITLQSGDETWQRHEFDLHGDVEFQPSHCSPIYYKEAFYFLDRFGNLGVFKLAMRKASWSFYSKPETLLNDYLHSSHLVECDGELFSVFIGDVGSLIQVFLFDYLKQKWDELDGLGDYSLFIGPRSSVSVMAKVQGMENRIYLPWRKDNDIVFYSFKTCLYHTSASEDPMENFYDMKGQSLCCWV